MGPFNVSVCHCGDGNSPTDFNVQNKETNSVQHLLLVAKQAEVLSLPARHLSLHREL